MSIYGVLEQLNPNFTESNLLSEEQMNKLKKDTFTMADYDVNVFFTLFPEFLKVFEKQENKFNFMYAFYLDIAKHLFSYEEYDRQQILCISLYLAHNIELSIGRNKNGTLNWECPRHCLKQGRCFLELYWVLEIVLQPWQIRSVF